MKLSEMKQILAEGDIQLTKSLGQNFLHDGNQLRRIVEAAEISPEDRILEIGPGLGPLTELLLARAREVVAIEKDGRLTQVLQQRFERQLKPGSAGLQLIHDDALEYLKRERRGWQGWKLVSNLPYSVASPILVELTAHGPGPDRMVATLQIEVARRLMASPGDADYGLLTVLMQRDYEPGGWFKIPASCFFPEPDVDSACICLVRRQQSLVSDDQRQTYTQIVKRSFSQRRKMMFKLLRTDWEAVALEKAFAGTGLGLQVRAEVVGPAQFAQLTRLLHVQVQAT